jgi:hypothetical protein
VNGDGLTKDSWAVRNRFSSGERRNGAVLDAGGKFRFALFGELTLLLCSSSVPEEALPPKSGRRMLSIEKGNGLDEWWCCWWW